MTSSLNRRVLATVPAGGLVAGGVAQAQAAELGFFEALFGGARPAAQAQAQAPEPSQPAYSGGAYRPRIRRAMSPRLRPRTRYAALPAAEPLKVRITDRQKAIDMTGGAAAALMKDETLRPGDIVVLHDSCKASRSLRFLLPRLLAHYGSLGYEFVAL